VSAKGDARPERQSSWASWARLGFAAFVWLHLVSQAYRAHDTSLFPAPSFEQRPLVVGLLLLVWLPFAFAALPELYRPLRRALPEHARERALAIVDPVALTATWLFAAQHVARVAWPLLSGAQLAEDVRPELTAALSSTYRGFPLEALLYLLAVGCAAFCAVRQAARALPARRELGRALVLAFVLAYVLGSYAVIRVASGELLSR